MPVLWHPDDRRLSAPELPGLKPWPAGYEIPSSRAIATILEHGMMQRRRLIVLRIRGRRVGNRFAEIWRLGDTMGRPGQIGMRLQAAAP
jgi:hypothetical protein